MSQQTADATRPHPGLILGIHAELRHAPDTVTHWTYVGTVGWPVHMSGLVNEVSHGTEA